MGEPAEEGKGVREVGNEVGEEGAMGVRVGVGLRGGGGHSLG